MSLLTNHFYRFGEFTLDTDQRVLLREGKPVALARKVFNTLLILVESNGRIVEKEELMNRLWPDTFVEEANLSFNIQQLRKSLGDKARDPIYIETIPRRGYRFIANVEEVLSDTSATGDQITRRLEISDAQSPDAVNGLERGTGAQKSEPAIESVNEGQSPILEKNLDAMPASVATLTGVSKRSVALRVALAIVLAGLGLVFWKLSNGLNKSLSEDKRVDGKSLASPLKLERLTGTGQSRFAAISPDGKYVAYTRIIEKKTSLWLRQFATNTNVEIVPAIGIIYGLAFTNSGDYLFFARRDEPAAGSSLYRTGLYRVSLVGGVPVKIVDKMEGNFSVSPDDSQIAFVRILINRDGQHESSLMIVNSDGSAERALLPQAHPDDIDAPLWSPDGQSVICAYGSSASGSQDVSIVEVRVADGTKRELSSDKFFHITKMAWLPGKSGLIMSARKKLEDSNQLWRVSYPGMEISQITEGLSYFLDLSLASGVDRAVASQATPIFDIWAGSSREPRNLKRITQGAGNFCWTPNGHLVYSSTASGNKDLWIMKPDGTEQRQLTVDTAVDSISAITPNNRYIAFLSNRSGSHQIWRMDTDGSNQIQLTSGTGKNYPAISPDGKWVLYNSTDVWHLWKVSIDGGEPVRLTGYIASHPSVSPDGKMIACLGRNGSKRELLILPFEGGQPLKRFDFAGWDSRLQWTKDGKALIYDVERGGTTAIIKQPLDGGLTEEIASFDEDEIIDFGYSFDGQFLAVTRGGWQHDIVLISDLNWH